jgi:hypothetical protein
MSVLDPIMPHATHSGGAQSGIIPGHNNCDNFCGIPQSLQATARIIPQIRPWQLPSMSFPIQYALIILPFDATELSF